MADAVKRLSVRLSVDGAKEARDALTGFAKTGDESLRKVGGQARETSLGLEALGRATNDNNGRMARFGDAFDTAEGKIKGTVRGLNDVRGAIELVAPEAAGATAGIGALANVVGNLSDVAGTLASVFLRNPLGLIALGLSAAVIGYASLRDNIDTTRVAEEGYQKAIAATNDLLETETQRTQRLARERAEATRITVESAIAAQRLLAEQLKSERDQLAQGGAALGANPEGDSAGQLRDFEAQLGIVETRALAARNRLADLEERLQLTSPATLRLAADLEKLRGELAGVGRTDLSPLDAANADFERGSQILQAAASGPLRLYREEYERLFDALARRRDLGIAAALEEEALRVQAANQALFASLQEAIDRTNAATDARQRAGAGIEAQIDRYEREAEATLAGRDALAAFQREQEEARVRQEAFNRALDAYGDDLEAVEGAVQRTTDAWNRLKDAQAGLAPAKSETDKLRESVDGLARGLETAGRRAARTFADMIVGANNTRVSVLSLIQAIAADIAEAQIRKNITGPLTDGLGSFFGGLPSLFGGGGAPVGNFGATFGGPRAMGGPVEPGVAYLVGEKRPEIFIPDTAGRIVPEIRRAPASAFSGADTGGAYGNASASPIVFNVYGSGISRDAAPAVVSERRGSDGSRQIDILIEDKIDAALAGGRFDGAMKNRYGARQTVKRT